MNIFTLSSLAAFSACEVEEASNENVATTLYADIEREGATKTYLSGPESGFYGTLWSNGDEIGVYSGSSTADPFKLTDGEDSNSGKFAGSTRTGDKTAVYPYSICGKLSGSAISVTLPEKQTYRSGNISSGAYPMVATGDDSNLRFKNLCSVLKISITGNVTVNSIVFSANDESVKSSGEATITVDAQNPKLVMSANANGSVELVCPSVILSDNPTDFYIVVPSQEYSSGFSLAIDTDKGNMVRATDNDITLKRSELYRINLSCRNEAADKKVVFEDNRFKTYLLATYDKNNDGEISYEEAEEIRRIVVGTDTIASLAGIECMPNLEFLSCNGTRKRDSENGGYIVNGRLGKLDVTKNTRLTYLSCSNNKLTSLDVTNNPDLDILGAYSNNLKSIDLSNNTKLRYLTLDYNQLTSLNIRLIPSLQSISCLHNQISILDLGVNDRLQTLDCGYNNIQELDLRNCQSLEDLSCYENKIESLDLSHNTKLSYLDFGRNSIRSVDLKGLTELTRLYCASTPISSLNLRHCAKLTHIYAFTTDIKALDISSIANLKYLNCRDTPLKYLYVREGQQTGIETLYIPSDAKIIVGSLPDDDEVFSVSPESFDLNGDEQEISLKVSASMDYSITSIPDWIIKKSENNGSFIFKVEANSTSSPRTGEIVFVNKNNYTISVEVKQSIQSAYTSSDYSLDGEVTLLRKATVGKGIDIVFVGEAFADRNQELFDHYAELGDEAFFTEEPFKSTKDRFNVYRINAVSKNGIICQEGGDTKFSAKFGDGTHIEGDDSAVFDFVRNALPSADLKKTMIIVIVNKAKYAGTCWMYTDNRAISYVPIGLDETDFAQTLRHEGCGHGFGKLADEYYYGSAAIPQNVVNVVRQWQKLSYGFYENVDFTSDPEEIRWSEFIFDERYSGKVGVFEGGYTYAKGAYRPTDYSIMRFNTGGFNAPSREAIYKKIMKFSEGDNWEFDYQEFVEFDEPARRAEAVTRSSAQKAERNKADFVPLAPPVMVWVGE